MKWYCTTQSSKWETINYDTQKEKNDIDSEIELTSNEKQTFKGFGGCFNELSYIALNKLSEEDKRYILELLYSKDGDGLHFNYGRIPIGANDYSENWYSYDETENDYEMKNFSIERDKKNIIPYINEALKRNKDITFFASPWSPPTWMKYPKVNNNGTIVMTKENLSAYALYFKKFVEEYAKENIKISQIHVQNEPVSSQKFPSCIWTGEEFSEFISEYMGPLFKKSKLDTQIWLGTLNGPETDSRKLYTRYYDYAGLVLNDKKTYKYISGVSYQWAGKYAVAQTKQSFPEIPVMQTENECGDGNNTWEYARYVWELFRNYITDGVEAYIYWNMILEGKGQSTWGWKQNSLISVNDGKYTLNYEYFLMKHFSAYVKPQAVVIELSGHWTGHSVAFKNPDGSVILNTYNPYQKAKTISFKVQNKKYVFELKPNSFNTMIIE